MTTLPTRETDGGIDLDVLAGQLIKSMHSYEVKIVCDLVNAAVAHTIERCAKVAAATKAGPPVFIEATDWHSGFDAGTDRCEINIRKLEP